MKMENLETETFIEGKLQEETQEEYNLLQAKGHILSL
jgi:hypothetical protein